MNRLVAFRWVSRFLRPFFGSGLGNVRLFRYVFNWVVSLAIPKQYVVLDINGCKLGMAVGGNSGMNTLAGGLISGAGYEVQTTELFKILVKQGMTVVDVGAHVGYYTILASKLVGNLGKVLAFEPESRNIENLEKNVVLNNASNVTVIGKAVTDKNSKAKLFISDNASGECSLVGGKHRPQKTVDVETVTLDSVLYGAKVDVMKVDVEGGEMSVLLGAHNVLTRNNGIKLFSECGQVGLDSVRYSPSAYWDKLVEYGFRFIYLIDDRGYGARLATLDDLLVSLRKMEGVNLLCAKEKVVAEGIDNRLDRLIPEGVMKYRSMRVQKRLHVLCGLLKEGDTVLDVGCGVGTYITNLLGYLPVRITAIDYDSESILYAQERNQHQNVEFVVASGETFRTNDRFALIICSHILEHNREALSILRNLKKLLKADGTMYIGIPNGYGDFEVENFLPRMLSRVRWGGWMIDKLRGNAVKDSLNDSQHIRFFTYGQIRALLEETGLRVVRDINEELFGGVISDRVILRSPLVARWNASIAEKLPAWLVNSWMFICKRTS